MGVVFDDLSNFVEYLDPKPRGTWRREADLRSTALRSTVLLLMTGPYAANFPATWDVPVERPHLA